MQSQGTDVHHNVRRKLLLSPKNTASRY